MIISIKFQKFYYTNNILFYVNYSFYRYFTDRLAKCLFIKILLFSAQQNAKTVQILKLCIAINFVTVFLFQFLTQQKDTKVNFIIIRN